MFVINQNQRARAVFCSGRARFITEHTLKTLHTLEVKEGFDSIDDCIRGLIDLYISAKTTYERVARQKASFKQDKEHYLPVSSGDYWFGFCNAAFRGSVTAVVASHLDKKPRTALNIAGVVVQDIMNSQEFVETYAKSFRKWYNQNQDILLTVKANEQLQSEAPQEVMRELSVWVSQRAYPRAKALAEVEPEE